MILSCRQADEPRNNSQCRSCNFRVTPFGFFKRVDGKITRQLSERNAAIKKLNLMMSLKAPALKANS